MNRAAELLRRAGLAATVGVLLLAGGCATIPPDAGTHRGDPFERVNRHVFEFNEGLDKAVIKPAAQVYQKVLPQFARQGISNFFGNLGDAWTSVNLLLQAKPEPAVLMGMRTAVNTVFGIGGLLDVAEEAGLERLTVEDFGQTLGRWGLGTGPYLVLPMLGPSNLRDATGRLLDVPSSGPDVVFSRARDRNQALLMQILDVRVELFGAERMLNQMALDKYTLIRDAYLARRRSLVYDGDPPEEPPAEGGNEAR